MKKIIVMNKPLCSFDLAFFLVLLNKYYIIEIIIKMKYVYVCMYVVSAFGMSSLVLMYYTVFC